MDQFTELKFLLSLDLEMVIVFCRVDCFLMCSKVTVPHFLCRGFSEGLSGVLCVAGQDSSARAHWVGPRLVPMPRWGSLQEGGLPRPKT